MWTLLIPTPPFRIVDEKPSNIHPYYKVIHNKRNPIISGIQKDVLPGQRSAKYLSFPRLIHFSYGSKVYARLADRAGTVSATFPASRGSRGIFIEPRLASMLGDVFPAYDGIDFASAASPPADKELRRG